MEYVLLKTLSELISQKKFDDAVKALRKYLIIWDFDGVFTSTERLSHYAAYQLLERCNSAMIPRHILSDNLFGHQVVEHREIITKLFKERLLKDVIFPAEFDTNRDNLQMEMFKDITYVSRMDELLEALNCADIQMSIATRSRPEPFWAKAAAVSVEKYIPKHHWFVNSQISRSSTNYISAFEKAKTRGLSKEQFKFDKTEAFAYAAETCGANVKRSIVVEDTVKGVKSAINAGCHAFAFLGAEDTNAEETRKQLKGIIPESQIADNAEDLMHKMLAFAQANA